ncbi:hypothetical protein CRG98_021507 [Punica granatum]|uniref:Uncharacterized protein n=1 Tax=Punica granatum TaxID=22663 RepID=A0A2I0JQA4_PUNGR|nr:hypothetical protein CRG98_021507 [Punica granatum]
MASHAFTSYGFPTTLTLPRDKVVACGEPFNHASPPFLSFLPSRIFPIFTSFLCIFQENLGMRDPRSIRSPTQPALREKATQIDRCDPDKLDCQSGLPVDPTAPTRVCSFQGAESIPEPLFPSFLDFSRILGLGLYRSRGSHHDPGKPKHALGFALEEGGRQLPLTSSGHRWPPPPNLTWFSSFHFIVVP